MNAPVRLVLDTNTVLAIWMFRDPALQSLEHLIAGGTVTLHSREDALEELRRVLAYSQFGVAIEAQAQLLAAYRARVMLLPAAAPGTREAAPPQPASIDLPPLLPQCRDRDDQKFLEIAAQAMATHLVTRAGHSCVQPRGRAAGAWKRGAFLISEGPAGAGSAGEVKAEF